jgi:hypothetical protein
MVAMVLACACGPSDEERFGESDEVEYGRCESFVADPTCVGLDCATSAGAREQLAIFLEVVEARGWTDVLTVTSAVFHDDPGTMRIEYFLQVGWLRAPGKVNIDVEGTALQQQRKYEEQVATWRVPQAVVAPAEIAAAIEGCDPELEVDPCFAFAADFVAHAASPGHDRCPSLVSHASVDAVSGELLDCRVDEPEGCEDSG